MDIMIDGENKLEDFKLRAQSYLIACSNRMIEESPNEISNHIDFVKQDSEASSHQKPTIRLYTEFNASEDGVKFIKAKIIHKIPNVLIQHVANVPRNQMEEIISFANMLNSGITTQQTHEQNQRNYNEATPDFSGEDH